MISFKEYDAESISAAVDDIYPLCDGADEEYLSSVVESFASLLSDEDVGVALCCRSGCLLVRIFDMGRYLFVYPIPLCDAADEDDAIDAVRRYAVKEEIPLCFSDVPAECLGTLLPHFRHVTADAEDAERGSYRVEALSELALADCVPEVSGETLSLSLISERDAREYARLCRDEDVNRYWGYDYRADVGEVADTYFVAEAISEYNRGVSLTLGARVGENFVGEAVLHAFDLVGGCEIAFRLLPEWQGRGLGRELLLCTLEMARRMGLCRSYARVMTENARSDALISKYMELIQTRQGQKKYRLEL